MKPKIVIVGLGLIGGSLALAIRKKIPNATVIGVSRTRSKIQQAIRLGAIHEGYTDVKKAAMNASLVVICTPVRNIVSFARKMDGVLPKGAVMTDVGSTKAEILRLISKSRLKHAFVGAHPMAGSHHAGLRFAQAGLFKRSTVFITPERRNPKSAVASVVKLWKALEARVVLISADRHDEIVASISHLPHVIAFALAEMTSFEAMKHCGNGFRDMTRLAQSDPELWRDIFLTNVQKIDRSIRSFQKELSQLQKLIHSKKEKQLLSHLHKACNKRQRLSFS